MKMTDDEQRALAFIAALLLLSAAVRVAALPEPMAAPAAVGFDIEAHIAATERAVADEERRSRPLADGERIDPNTASADELDRLPGVGPAVARRIVEARADGRFRSAADLTRVTGVGERTVERLAPFLELPAATGSRAGARVRRSTRRPAGAADVGAPGVGDVAGDVGGGGRGGAAAVLDVNSAGAEALMSLPGVGPVLAGRIVAHRDSAGPFLAVDSLVRVRGIGPATLERIRARVRVR